MALFLSTHVNKIDRKGRISVPATFRAALAGQPTPGVVVFRSLQAPALEGCSWDHMEQLSANLDRMDIPPDEKDLLATTIFGGSLSLALDSEGRIVLPRDLADFAGITDQASFVGLGRTFQIWNPDTFADHQAAARDAARQRGMSLRSIMSAPASAPGAGGSIRLPGGGAS